LVTGIYTWAEVIGKELANISSFQLIGFENQWIYSSNAFPCTCIQYYFLQNYVLAKELCIGREKWFLTPYSTNFLLD